jgi:hypothetical protein
MSALDDLKAAVRTTFTASPFARFLLVAYSDLIDTYYGGGAYVGEEVESTAGSRTTLTLLHAPVGAWSLGVYYQGQRLRRVVATPGVGEYTWATTTVTLGFTATDGQWLYASYLY